MPRQILVAIWGLETDFGKGDMGRLPVIRTLATLAHDCRRTELFQGELLAALKIVQRGDLPLRDLIGAYAGEIGQTQFLPSSYIKYGVDFDGDGRVDLRHSVADVLASTANLLHTNGFKMGEPYGEGSAEFRGDARMESRDDLSQDHRVFRRPAGRAVRSRASSPSSRHGMTRKMMSRHLSVVIPGQRSSEPVNHKQRIFDERWTRVRRGRPITRGAAGMGVCS